jgi:hypothetical protein
LAGWRREVTKTSDCYKWLKKLMSSNIDEFYFKELPGKLKDKSMLHRAAASDLIKAIKIDNNGRKKWKLDRYQIRRIEDKYRY